MFPAIPIIWIKEGGDGHPIALFDRPQEVALVQLDLPSGLPKEDQKNYNGEAARSESKAQIFSIHPMSEFQYRSNVAGILRRANGQILVCERLHEPDAWQFPQGGVDPGESLETALARELGEEIGVGPDDYQIVSRRGPYRYLYGGNRIKKGFHGKEQHYFLCDFRAPDSHINVATAHPEFSAWKWIDPAAFQVGWLPEMKLEVYRAVFRDFFGIRL